MQIAVGLGIAGTALLLFSGCTSASGGFTDDVAFMKRHTPIVLMKDGDAAVAETPSPAETPNVIFILMDDMGYKGYIGHEFIPTRDPLEGLREAVALCNG